MISLEATSDRLRAERTLFLRKMKELAHRRSNELISRGNSARSFALRNNNLSFRGRRSGSSNQTHSPDGSAPSTPRAGSHREERGRTRERQLQSQLQRANEQLRQVEENQMRMAIAASQQQQQAPPPYQAYPQQRAFVSGNV